MSVRYKITATIIKPGNTPVLWLRYSDHRMTRTDCETMFSIKKEPGRSFGIKLGWRISGVSRWKISGVPFERYADDIVVEVAIADTTICSFFKQPSDDIFP